MTIKKIIKSSAWYVSSKGIVMLTTLLSIPFFTHYMTTEEYGEFSLFLTYASMLIPILSLGVYLSYGRAKVDFDENFKKYSQSIILFSLISTASLSIIIIIFENHFKVLFSGSDNKSIYFLLIYVLFSVCITNALAFFQFDNQFKKVSSINTIRGVLGVSLGVLLVYSTDGNSYSSRVYGLLIVDFAIFLLIFILIFKESERKEINCSHVKYAVKYSAPLIFGSLSYVLNNQFDRIVLDEYLGLSEVGVYSFAYTVGMLLLTIAIACRQGINPHFYKLMIEGKKNEAKKINVYFSLVFFLLSVIFILLSDYVVKTISSRDFFSASKIIPYIILASFIQILILSESELQMYEKKTKVNSMIILLGCVINVILNMVFIPKYGVIAAAITTLVTYVVMYLISKYYNLIILKTDMNSLYLSMLMLAFSSVILLFV